MLARLNADTAAKLQADNGRLRVEKRELETRLAEIVRLATPADPYASDPQPVRLDAVYLLTFGIRSQHAGRLTKISGDSHHGLALRDLISATASIITNARKTMDDSEDVEQRALDLLDAVIADIVATIPD